MTHDKMERMVNKMIKFIEYYEKQHELFQTVAFEYAETLKEYPELLISTEVEKILRIDTQTLRRMRNRGEIKFIDLAGVMGDRMPRHRYYKKDIVRLLTFDRVPVYGMRKDIFKKAQHLAERNMRKG